MAKNHLIAAIALLCFGFLQGQLPMNFERIHNENLSIHPFHKKIQKISQDPKGLLWIQFDNGIAYYNGKKAIPFSTDEESKFFLNRNSDGTILAHQHCKDNCKSQWISGLDKVKETHLMAALPQKIAIEKFPELEMALLMDSTFLEYAEQILKQFTELQIDEVIASLVSPSHKAWIVTKSGLLVVKKENEGFAIKNVPVEQKINCIEAWEENKVLLGTDSGIFYFSPEDSPSPQFLGLQNFEIACLEKSKSGKIWAGTPSMGVFILDPKRPTQVEHQIYEECNPKSILPGKVRDIFESKDGIIWIVAEEGVSTFDPQKHAFGQINHHNCNPFEDLTNILDLFEDSRKNLWALKYNGLHQLTSTGKTTRSYSFWNRPSIKLPFKVAEPDSMNNVWVGAGSELFSVQCISLETSFFQKEIILGEGGNWRPRCLKLDRDRLIVGASGHGLAIFDVKSGELLSHISPSNENSKLHNGYINEIFKDSKGSFWILTEFGGLYRTNSEFKSFKHFSIGDEPNTPGNYSITSIAEDLNSKEDQLLYIGTSAGILKLSLDKGKLSDFQQFSKATHHLQSNNISGIQIDNKGAVWASSDLGLSKLWAEKDSVHVINFDQFDGLQAGFFSLGASLKLSNGKIAFGGENGVNLFSPSQVNFRAVDSIPFYLSKVNRIGESGKAKSISQFPCKGEKFELAPDQNTLEVELIPIEYRNPDKVRICSQLFGHDPVPVTSSSPALSFINLPSGHYPLAVKVIIDRIGNWKFPSLQSESDILSLKIDVVYYKKPWVILLFAAAVFAIGGFLGDRAKKTSEERKRELLEREKVEVAEKLAVRDKEKARLEKQKLEFRWQAIASKMDSHFLKNALNSVQGMVLSKNPLDASDALVDISRLVQLSMELSAHSLIPLETEIEYLRLYLAVEVIRYGEKIKWNIDTQKIEKWDDWNVPPMVIQIYVENAVKHGISHRKQGGIVNLQFLEEEDNLKCIIDDDGVGRSEKTEAGVHGMKLAEERLNLLERISGIKIQPKIIDKVDKEGSPAGTTIIIHFPKIIYHDEV